MSVTVDNVEYVHQGSVRNGASVIVAVLATSTESDRLGPNGAMTLVEDEGEKYTGTPAVGFGARTALREGVPVKLTCQFGPNPISGKSSAPSAKITRFVAGTIEPTAGGDSDPIDFRSVTAAVTTKS